MISLVAIWIALQTAAAIVLAASTLGGACRHRRRAARLAEAEQHYLSLLIPHLLAEHPAPCRLPHTAHRRARLALARALGVVASATYGFDERRIEAFVVQYDLDTLLVRRARRHRGYRRAGDLHLLSMLPAREAAMQRLGRLERCRNPYVRLYLLLARIRQAPAATVQLIEHHPDPLTPYAVAELLVLLRRGLIPIACEPLVESASPNVKLLGLAIVRYFGVEEAEHAVLSAVLHPNAAVSHAALRTLCALRRPVTRIEVGTVLTRMSPSQRRMFYRHLAAEGYSVRAIAALLADDGDGTMGCYFERLTGSYKRRLRSECTL